MLEYAVVFLIVGIAACYAAMGILFRKHAGCGCGRDAARACSVKTSCMSAKAEAGCRIRDAEPEDTTP